MKSMRRMLAVVFLMQLGWVLFCPGAGLAQQFPRKPIQIYVGYIPGGGASVMATAVATKATEILGAPVTVTHKPGAAGSLSVDFVRTSAPDGHTLVMTTMSNFVTAPVLSKVPYKIQDFEFFGMYGVEPMFLVVNSKSSFRTVEDLIEYARKHPNELKYASVGHGSGVHLAVEMFNHVTGIKTVQIPMKGAPEIVSSILGEHTQFGLLYSTGIRSIMEGDKVRFLATTADERVSDLPNVPTLKEKGYTGVGFLSWYGVAGPVGIPKPISETLTQLFEKTFKNKDFLFSMEKIGVIPKFVPGTQLPEFVRSEQEKLREFVKKTGLDKE